MIRGLLLAAIAVALGIGGAEFLSGQVGFRRWLGHVVRRDELRVLVGRHGIYQSDFERTAEAHRFAGAPVNDENRLRRELIAEAEVNAAARDARISTGAVDHEMDLLRWQFRDEKTWEAVLRNAATSRAGLRREAATNLRDRVWIEGRISKEIQPNEGECRRYFAEHRAEFEAPPRVRASHLFLAAPDGYPAEVIETKRALIEQLSKRLANGEAFPALVAEYSEDEATKKRGGDLGYFAAERMLPAVWDAAAKLHPGEISAPVRSRLGFHILRLTESLPARSLTFEEARPEILTTLENQKRLAAVKSLTSH